MVKDIENEFFKAFKPFGILHSCFSWMEREYNFWFYSTTKTKSKAEWSKETLDLHNKQQQKIKDQVEKFEHGIVWGYDTEDTPLMVEISNNLDECKGDERATERYIYDLLTPFRLYSDKMNPKAVIEDYRASLEACQKNLQVLEQAPDGTMDQTQIKTYKASIERLLFQIDQATYVANRYINILNETWGKTGTVESCLGYLMFYIIRHYAIYLDVLLLKRGINLLYYQQECGIYLFKHRNKTVLEDYLGGRKLAQKYIDEALPKLTTEPKHPDKEIVLPDELNTPEAKEMAFTERAKKYFAKAIEAGFMEQRGDHYKWLYDDGSKVSLGNFLVKVYCPNNTERLPLKALEKLFGIERLDRAVNSFNGTRKKQKWLPPIDSLFVIE